MKNLESALLMILVVAYTYLIDLLYKARLDLFTILPVSG